MKVTTCPACHGKEINDKGCCTGCGFDVGRYLTLSVLEKGILLYKHAHPEGVVESKKVERGEMHNLLHEGHPVRKCSNCGEVYLDAHSNCPKCHAPNPSREKTDAGGDGVVGQESKTSESDVAKALDKTNELLEEIQAKIAEKKKMSWFSVCSAVFVAVLLWSEVQGCANKIKDALTSAPVYRY